MQDAQAEYDDGMFEFSKGEYDSAIAKFESILHEIPDHFDSRMALSMAWYRKGDFTRAIEEGHRAEQLKPNEQLVHTNLSLYYVKLGDKQKAEHHGLQARIASWRGNMDPPAKSAEPESGLSVSKPSPPPLKPPEKFPDMPWKKKTKIGGDTSA